MGTGHVTDFVPHLIGRARQCEAMPSNQTTIWTIGHSNRSINDFLALLQAHDIESLADVRRFPGSRRHPQFGQEQISGSLKQSGIDYAHFPELGGRRPVLPHSPNSTWRNAAFRGYADYMLSPEFRAGIERLLTLA